MRSALGVFCTLQQPVRPRTTGAHQGRRDRAPLLVVKPAGFKTPVKRAQVKV